MNIDFKIGEKERFSSHVASIIYNKDKTKVLLAKMTDKNYYLLPGGRIEFFENSLDAIKREIKEELGYDLEFKLKSIQEIFLVMSEKMMQYCFCYEAIYDGEIIDGFKCLDNEYQTFYWIDIKELDSINIVPHSAKNLIRSNKKEFEYVIDYTDESNL